MTALGTTSKVHFGYRDRSGELTGTQLHFAPIDDGADNSAILDPTTGAIAVVGTAAALLTKCRQAGDTLSIKTDNGLSGLPTAADAQREWAIRFRYQDDVTSKLYRFDIPAPIDAVVQDGTDQIDMAETLVAAFKVAFEANCVSQDGNAVTLLDGRIVGRRN